MSSIQRAMEEALIRLRAADSTNPDTRLEVEIVLAHVLNKNRAYLFAHPEVLLNANQLNTFQTCISQRVQGIPLAYIIGEREFWSLSLKVNQHTLIPRHETERLVELALELIPNRPGIRVLDLGTGSGAIALALAKERPDWVIDACDKSEDALTVAKENAMNHKVSTVHFYKSDWFNQLPPQQYHAIVSNPPYIAANDPHLSQGDLRFEPLNALVSSQEGFADLQYIIKQSIEWLSPGGLLLLEHGYDQKTYIKTILDAIGYQKVHCWQDIQGHDRVSGGWWMPSPSV